VRELSLNVMDIAQNSITAKASLVEIRELHDVENAILTLSVADSGCGMTAEQVGKVQNPFYTTRTTREVGLGVPLFKMACDMTGGSFSLESAPGKGTTVTARFMTGHIDMTPVGDMAETIVLLIFSNPDIDFIYEKKIGGKGYTLDTRELREALGGEVSLSDLEVITWIRDYLAEQEMELQ